MNKDLLSEEEVKDKLGISDFRSLKKSQIIEFVSMIPHMDKEVAIACVNQFPNFKDFSNTAISHFNDLCTIAIEKDHNGSIAAYRSVIDSMKIIAERENISTDDRNYLIDKMIELAEKIEGIEDKKQGFAKQILTAAGAIIITVLSAGAALLGINSKKS